jgi:anhydro-N-acetylmuramic acid kinase
MCRLDTAIGQLFGEVGALAIRESAEGAADLVASHGQTVYHWVEGEHALGTLQLGGAAWIAEATGIPVVADLRTRDITRGGHAAPLASLIDSLLVLGDEGRVGSLNLGGISNITLRDDAGRLIAYDIGPASALMDSVVTDATAGTERMDTGGERAARGSVDAALLAEFLDEPYYALPTPKSTGKELFHADYVRGKVGGRSIATDDLIATLTELTAVLIAREVRFHGLDELVVAGGGVRNPTLMRRLGELCAPATLLPFEALGIPAQGKEAYVMAIIGFLTVHGLPGTIPSATGARGASILGSVTPGSGPLRLPEPASVPPTRLTVVTP